MAQHSKGTKELARMKSASRAATAKVSDTNFAPGAHPRRGQIADAQVAGDRDPRQRQPALDRVVQEYKERLAAAAPLGSHDDE